MLQNKSDRFVCDKHCSISGLIDIAQYYSHNEETLEWIDSPETYLYGFPVYIFKVSMFVHPSVDVYVSVPTLGTERRPILNWSIYLNGHPVEIGKACSSTPYLIAFSPVLLPERYDPIAHNTAKGRPVTLSRAFATHLRKQISRLLQSSDEDYQTLVDEHLAMLALAHKPIGKYIGTQIFYAHDYN